MDGESTPQAGQSPPDPFHPGHITFVAVLENFRNYRRVGGSWLDAIGCQAAVLVAGHIISNGGEEEGG